MERGDSAAKERTGLQPSYAEAEKMKLLILHTMAASYGTALLLLWHFIYGLVLPPVAVGIIDRLVTDLIIAWFWYGIG